MNEPQQPQQPIDPAVARQAARLHALASLVQNVRNGASNYYWIVGLSVINTVLASFDSNTRFINGLGITQVIDVLAFGFADAYPEMALVFKGVGLALDLGLLGLFTLFGWLGAKGNRFVYVTGMVLYALDGILMLFLEDWFSAGFHVFILWGLWGGLQSLNELKRIEAEQNNSAVPPMD